MFATKTNLDHARRLLCALQVDLRDTLIAARARRAQSFARVAAVTAADTIYQVDRISEAAILAWFGRHWPRAWPVELVMEGAEEGVTFPRGTPVAKLVPYTAPESTSFFGSMRGTVLEYERPFDPIDGDYDVNRD